MYDCPAGFKTIGYGHNLETTPITKLAAKGILMDDMLALLPQVEQLPKYSSLSEPRKAVLMNMAFNLGIVGLKRFKKMFAAIEENDFDTAADEMLDSKWATQVKGRAERLAEAMRKG